MGFNAEFLQQLTLIADNRPETGRTGIDLKNSCLFKMLDHIGSADKVVKTSGKYFAIQGGVGNIGEFHPEATEHFAGGKHTALGIPQPLSIGQGGFIPGTPQQGGFPYFSGDAGHRILCTKIAVGDEDGVYLVDLHLLDDSFHIPDIINNQALFVDIFNSHDLDAIGIFLQLFPDQLIEFDSVRHTEDSSSGGDITKNQFFHE